VESHRRKSHGRSKLRKVLNIKSDLSKLNCEVVDLIEMSCYRLQWRNFVNTVDKVLGS